MPLIREFQETEGILVFDRYLDSKSSYHSGHLDSIHQAESKHFWFEARRDKVCRVFVKHIDSKMRILEIGGGTGYIAEGLQKIGYSVEMADIHRNGLLYAKKRGIQKLYQFDLFSPPFAEEFDVICLFDVLEHLEDDSFAIESIQKMLKPKGKIILTVPAHQWLWCRDDVLAGHKRRYTKTSLSKCLHGMRIIEIQYFFVFLLPFLFLRKWMKSKHEQIEFTIHPLLNGSFQMLSRVERALEQYLPNLGGGSLLVIVEK